MQINFHFYFNSAKSGRTGKPQRERQNNATSESEITGSDIDYWEGTIGLW